MPLFTIWNTFHNDNSVIPDAKYEPKTCIAIAACLFSNSTLLDSYHLLLHPWQKCCLGLFGSTSMKWSHPCDLFFFLKNIYTQKLYFWNLPPRDDSLQCLMLNSFRVSQSVLLVFTSVCRNLSLFDTDYWSPLQDATSANLNTKLALKPINTFPHTLLLSVTCSCLWCRSNCTHSVLLIFTIYQMCRTLATKTKQAEDLFARRLYYKGIFGHL